MFDNIRACFEENKHVFIACGLKQIGGVVGLVDMFHGAANLARFETLTAGGIAIAMIETGVGIGLATYCYFSGSESHKQLQKSLGF